MNFCTKCQSIYSQPGTCNCFAPNQPKFVPPAAPQPWYPNSPTIGAVSLPVAGDDDHLERAGDANRRQP